MTAWDESDSESQSRDERLFSPSVTTVILLAGGAAAALLFFSYETRHTALLAPVDPRFRGILAAIGAFAGVWVAAIAREPGRRGSAKSGKAPNGVWGAIQLAGVVVLGGFCGAYAAELATEWRAFHGLRPESHDQIFTVVDVRRPRKGPDSLELRAGPGTASFTISCGFRPCRSIAVGDRLSLSVETGRGGIQRAVLPAYPRDAVVRG